MSLERPSDGLSNQIVSAYRITNICQCIDELIFNSIDAGSSSIGVRVQLQKFRLQLIDNGCGIDRTTLINVGNR